MDKRQLRRIAMASITELQAREDPAGAFHVALTTIRAAHAASQDAKKAAE